MNGLHSSTPSTVYKLYAVYYMYNYREGKGRKWGGGGGKEGEGGMGEGGRRGISDKSYDTISMQDGLLWITVQMLQAKIRLPL